MVRRPPALAALGAALLVALGAGYAVWSGGLGARAAARPQQASRAPSPIISPYVVPAAPPTPTEASHPGVRIDVPELRIDLPVVEGDGFNAPLYQAAHYPGMPWPGEGGRSVIYAHARAGMFGPLFGARVGEHVDITRPGGPALHYVIREYYPRWPITDLRWLRPGDHEEVVLVTCTTYNYNDPRIVAVAEPA